MLGDTVYPHNDKEILNAIFSRIKNTTPFVVDRIVTILGWKIPHEEILRLRDLLKKTGFFLTEPVFSTQNTQFKIKTEYLQKINRYGSYSNYIYNNGMPTQELTLNAILEYLQTEGEGVICSIDKISNNVGFNTKIIEGSKSFLVNNGYISSTKEGVSILSAGIFFDTRRL